MSQTTTREERRSALDDFASLDTRTGFAVPAVIPPPNQDEIHGAIQVAVKRDERQVLARLKVLAAAAGTDWYYRWPVRNRKKNRIDWVEGPSIKLANDLARIYGNCDVDGRMALDLGQHWLFQARFIDLETGFSLSRPFQQRKSGSKLGTQDAERQLDIAMQIGASKAIRNVVVNALQTFADYALDEARSALIDRIEADLDKWRRRTVDRLAERKVELARVEAVIGREAQKWQAADIARVIAMMTAVADEMVALDEVFPPLSQNEDIDGDDKKPVSSALDQFAKSVEAAQGPSSWAGQAVSSDPSSGSARRASADDNGGGEGLQQASAAADASIHSESPAGRSSAGEGSGDKTSPRVPPSPLPPDAITLRKEAIDAALELAGRTEFSADERLAQLGDLELELHETAIDPGFVRTLIETAKEVVRKKTPKAAAQRYLASLKADG